MKTQSTHAGGFFLVITILGGFALGNVYGAALVGAVIGTLVGISAATLVWLRDRRDGRG